MMSHGQFYCHLKNSQRTSVGASHFCHVRKKKKNLRIISIHRTKEKKRATLPNEILEKMA
jgi:hypothetical protein